MIVNSLIKCKRRLNILFVVSVSLGLFVFSGCSGDIKNVTQVVEPPVVESSIQTAENEGDLTVEDGTDSEGKDLELSQNPIQNQPVTDLVFLEGKQLGTLKVDNRVLTPDQTMMKGVRIAFQLEKSLSHVLVHVIDAQGSLVGTFETVYKPIIDEDAGWDMNCYEATMADLVPGTVYQYVIEAEGLVSSLSSFRIPEVDEATTLLFLGDAQGYAQRHYDHLRDVYEEALTVAETRGTVDLTYMAGDIVDIGDNEEQWSYFYRSMEPFLMESLFITAIGNHDTKSESQLYRSAFNYPINGITGLEDRNFYIDLPFARIAVWDTESSDTFDAQGQWLKDIMSQVPDKFKLVLMHRSAYPMSYDEGYIRELSTFFEVAEIDLVLSGHDHIYNRTTMKADHQVDIQEGVTYIVGGSSSGSKYYETDEVEQRYWKNVVYDDDNPVFTLINISETTLKIEAYAQTSSGIETIDSFTLKK